MGLSVNSDGFMLSGAHARCWYGTGGVGIVLLRNGQAPQISAYRLGATLCCARAALLSRPFFLSISKTSFYVGATAFARYRLRFVQCSSALRESGSRPFRREVEATRPPGREARTHDRASECFGKRTAATLRPRSCLALRRRRGTAHGDTGLTASGTCGH